MGIRIKHYGLGGGHDTVKAVWYHEISSGTTGQITIPTGGTILLDEFASQVDALCVTMSGVGGFPAWQTVEEADTTVVVVSSFDTSGNYVLSGTPSSYPVALVFVYIVAGVDYDYSLDILEHEIPGAVDHGNLRGTGDDDHTQYALLAGRSGGQTLIGGTAASNNLTLQSTSHGTKGSIILGDRIDVDSKGINFSSLGYAVNTPLTNKSGASTVVGYVYRLDPDNNNSFDYAEEDCSCQIVVAMEVAADSATCQVHLGGGIVDVYVDDDATRGQYVYAGSTSGQAKTSWNRYLGAFAKVTANRTGAGLVKCKIFDEKDYNPNGNVLAWQNARTAFLPVGSPVAYASNPVIPYTDSDPESIMLFHDGQQFVLFEKNFASDGIYRRTSDDCITWTSAVKVASPSADNMGHFGMIYDVFETDSSKRWKMWHNLSSAGKPIKYRTSADGITWSSESAVTAPASWPTDGWGTLKVIRVGSAFYMYFSTASAASIKLAVSSSATDFSTGVTEITALSLGAGGTWDDSHIIFPSPFWIGGNFFLMYGGDGTGGGGGSKTGMSVDYGFGRHTYEKWYLNPIVSTGAYSTMCFHKDTIYVLVTQVSGSDRKINLYKWLLDTAYLSFN